MPGTRQRLRLRLGDRLPRQRHDTFAALRVRNYRRFFTGQAVSLVGTWMQSVALSWLAFELSHPGTTIGLVLAVPVPRSRRRLPQGLRYIASRTDLLAPLLMMALIGTLADEFPVALPLLADRSLDGGADPFGALAAPDLGGHEPAHGV